MAARISGAGNMRIITRHLLPSFLSYLIVNLTLSIPSMILAETAVHDDVAVDRYDVVGVGGADCPITNLGQSESIVRLPHVSNRYGRFRAKLLDPLARVIARTVVGHQDLVRRSRLHE